MNKIKFSFLLSAAVILGSCSDDVITSVVTDPEIIEVSGARVSYFNLEREMVSHESVESVVSARLKTGLCDLRTMTVEILPDGERLRCGLHLPQDSFPDGSYLLTFYDSEGDPLQTLLKISVEQEKVVGIEYAESTFTLRKGSGTEEDPYLIESERDFFTFLDDLRVNADTNGKNVWFRQTADIQLFDQSSTKPGRGYYGYAFAGHYDGGGHALYGMYYRGAKSADSDSGVGLFPALLDGATVSDLRILGANVTDVYADTGILAGVTAGDVTVSGVSVNGLVDSDAGASLGAFVGRHSQGVLTFRNVELQATVEGHSGVGGLLGTLSDGSFVADGVSTPDSHFSVTGYDSCGGLLGSASDGVMNISNVELSHVVSREDADIRIVCSTGGEGTGGLVGSVGDMKLPVEIRNVTVMCPVGGLNLAGNKIGGLIGNYDSNQSLTLSKCRVTSIVSGNHEVGGLVGHLYLPGGGVLYIEGGSADNYVLPDDSAAGIEANSSAGGAFGYLGAKSINAQKEAVRIAVNVKTTGEQAGGIVGKMYDASLDVSVFNMSSPTMQVLGKNRVGGLVGLAIKSTLSGQDPFNYTVASDGKAVIPKEDSFHPAFRGTVKGTSDVGGLIGMAQNTTLKAMNSASSVIGLGGGGNLGGIVGTVEISENSVKLEDLTSSSEVVSAGDSNIGGICGSYSCTRISATTDCINYGTVSGKDNVGGVFGYYSREWYLVYDNGMTSNDINWCLNVGDINGSSTVGGICGRCRVNLSSDFKRKIAVKFFRCGNNGKISGAATSGSTSGVGGILGNGSRQIELRECANNGLIYSDASHKSVGGIAGSLGDDAYDYKTDCLNVAVYQCVNGGTIDSRNSKSRAGGVIGFMEEGPDSYVDNCLNLGEVLNKHESDNGGIVGYVDHLTKIYRCVNLGKISNGNATIGTHKTGSSFSHDALYYLEGTGSNWPSATSVKASDIGNKGKFPKLDFTSIWSISESGPYIATAPFRP